MLKAKTWKFKTSKKQSTEVSISPGVRQQLGSEPIKQAPSQAQPSPQAPETPAAGTLGGSVRNPPNQLPDRATAAAAAGRPTREEVLELHRQTARDLLRDHGDRLQAEAHLDATTPARRVAPGSGGGSLEHGWSSDGGEEEDTRLGRWS